MPRLARVALLLCSLVSSQDDCAAPADIAVFDDVLSDAALAALDAVLNTTRSRMIRIAAPPDDVAARTAAAVAASFGERGLLEVWSRDRYDPSVAFHFDMDEGLNDLDLVAPPATLYIFCVDHDDDLAAPTTMIAPDGVYAVPVRRNRLVRAPGATLHGVLGGGARKRRRMLLFNAWPDVDRPPASSLRDVARGEPSAPADVPGTGGSPRPFVDVPADPAAPPFHVRMMNREANGCDETLAGVAWPSDSDMAADRSPRRLAFDAPPLRAVAPAVGRRCACDARGACATVPLPPPGVADGAWAELARGAADAAAARLEALPASDAYAHLLRGRLAVRAAVLARRPLGEARRVLADACQTVPNSTFYDHAAEADTLGAQVAACRRDVALVDRFMARGAETGGATPMAVEDARTLTAERFEREYAKPRVPVLIRGWSLDLTWDSLVRTCGHLRPPLRTRGTSDAWAGLEYARGSNGRQGPKTLADVVSGAKEGGMLHEGDVFDWDATRPGGCGTLLETLVVPKYFSGALGFFGPGLFVQRNASGGGPHEDAFATSFWQYLAEGRKRWRVAAPGAASDLYATARDWADAHFPDVRCPKSPYARAFAGGDAADCGAPRPAELFGDVPGLAVWEAVAEPGDLVYVPPTAPHQVRTLAPSLALSMNRLEAAALPDAQASLYVAAPESGFGYARPRHGRPPRWFEAVPLVAKHPWLQTLRGTLSRLQAHGEGLAALADRGKAAELAGRPGLTWGEFAYYKGVEI